MKKSLMTKIFAAAASLLLVFSIATAQTRTRVRFQRGRNSATVTGTLAPGGVRTYVLGARAGQTLTATLSSGNGKVDFTQGSVHDTQFSRTVDANGDTE